MDDLPHADKVICEAGEEGLAISGPREGDTLWFPCTGVLRKVRLELVNDRPTLPIRRHTTNRADRYSLALKIEDFDAGGCCCAKPVAVGGEDEGVDDVTSLEGVEVLALVEVPKHGDAVLSAGGSERTVGRDGNSVVVTGVAVVVGLELELRELPNLSKKKWVRNSSKRRFGLRVKRSEILVILFGLIGS